MKWIYQQKPPLGTPLKHDPSLVGYWAMQEGSGDRIYDLSGNGNTGILTNMNPKTDWVPGKFGKALDFDGVNNYVGINSDKSLELTGATTWGAWINADVMTAFSRVLQKGHAAGTNVGYGFALDAESQMTAWYREGDAGNTEYSIQSSVLSTSQWYHIVGVYDGFITIDIYVNGQYDSNGGAQGGWVASATNLDIGRRAGIDASFFNGIIDNVSIYNRALSAQEIQQLYYESFGMFEKRPGVARVFVPAAGAEVYSGRGIGRGLSRGIYR